MVIRELEHIIQKALPRAVKDVFAEHFTGELREGKAETDEALFPFYDSVESHLSRNTKSPPHPNLSPLRSRTRAARHPLWGEEPTG